MITALAGADTATPAVILKFDPNVMHHGGLGAIRSLGRAGVPVYGVHEGAWAPAAHSAYLSGRMFWHPDPDQSERTRAGLIWLAGRIGRRAVLIPTDDAGSIFLAEQGGGLRKWFAFADPPAALPRRVAGKHSLHTLCRELGVAAPAAAVPTSAAAAGEFAATVGYPLVAKLSTPWRLPAGLRSTTVVGSERELGDLYRACQRHEAGLVLQELIPAGPGGDWFCHAYRGSDSVCRAVFTGVKDRSYPAHAGLTSRGHAARNERLAGQVTALLDRLCYQGIADLDLRQDARTGEYRLLDFNPRLGAQFRLLRDQAGLDVVLAAYLDLTGQPVTAGEQADGRTFLVENYDPLAALGYWRRGELGLTSWLASARQTSELAWFAGDDLRPFGLMCARMGWRAVSRPFARRGRPAAVTGNEPRFRPGRAEPAHRAWGHRPAHHAGQELARRPAR